MKFQVLPVIFFFASQALAACGPNQVELWDLQVIDGTAQCSNYDCYKACPGQGGSGSCNGCTSRGGPNVRTLGASYCCDGPLVGLTNTCVTRCSGQ
ncbi:hypothetical protein BFJ63_vAg19587 [Fusarium oxysporum f. sp. narcissi]|uniref:Uncharacterized protein n=1 Tax=Fusarium oxysporum f. sp. narcissi TaxID=451672 RepID=A0A4Q2UZ56_FUSOX|nr:hypothetical protein BFJ63_vAg19587 [Fusarium oxysporum f. sp. narcissi]